MKEFHDMIDIPNLIAGGLVGGFLVWWAKRLITRLDEKKSAVIEKQRTTVIEFFALWQRRRSDYSDEWQKSFNNAANQMILWCPDDVLYHFAMYLKPTGEKTTEATNHFGCSVLSFRKTLGYKNRGNKITPEHITRIYSVGEPDAAV
jgi:hypothetical protein